MVGWHHRLNGHGFWWTLGVGDWQGGLACCGSLGRKESDTTERLNWTELNCGRWLNCLCKAVIFASNAGAWTWSPTEQSQEGKMKAIRDKLECRSMAYEDNLNPQVSCLWPLYYLRPAEDGILHCRVKTHWTSESESWQKDPAEGGALADLAVALRQWSEPEDKQQCLWATK